MDKPFPLEMMPYIEKFFESEASRPEGLDSYDDVFNSEWFFPLQRRRELEEMMRLARTVKPQVVMEIGSDKGSGLYHWCKSLTTVNTVIACEIRGLPYRHLFEQHFEDIDFKWLEESSLKYQVRDEVQHFLWNRKIDGLFIDGDKGAFHVDFELYAPLVRKGGLIFMHDIYDDPVNKAWQRCSSGRASSTIEFREEALEAVAKQKRGEKLTRHEEWLAHWKGQSCCVGVIFM